VLSGGRVWNVMPFLTEPESSNMTTTPSCTLLPPAGGLSRVLPGLEQTSVHSVRVGDGPRASGERIGR
jgi:hypothetical protein